MKLIIGNKAYSSWSLRGWLACKQSGLPFEEVVVPLYDADWDRRRAGDEFAPSGGKVPVLWDGEVVVCSPDRGIAEGFRLPRLDPRFASNLRKNGRAGPADPSLGASGVGSCSRSGAGGFTGCSKKEYNAWAEWKRKQKAEAHAYENPE